MEFDDENSASVRNLIDDVVEASKVPAKNRQISIKSRVEELASLAYEHGLLPEDLNELIDLITTPNHLDQASLAAIVKNLYPVSKVSEDIVLKVVGSLGHGQIKPSLAIQSHLLRWVVLVYHALRSHAALSQVYGVLFNLLDTAAIRPQLCHLLALITRRKHVRPHRIQAVLNLSRQTGHDPGLLGLLRVYKNYYPEIIVGEATRGKASPFKHPDPQWRTRLDEIWTARREREDNGIRVPQNGFRVNHQRINQIKGQASGAIPVVHTSHAQESSVTLEEIDNPDDLVQNLEKIELPNQLVAVLADPLLQKLLHLRPDDDAHKRASNWMMGCITDISSGDADASSVADILESVRDYAVSTKILPPLFLRMMREVLNAWDGVDRKDIVLDILSHAPLIEFEDLFSSVFQPFETCILDNTAESQLILLSQYTLLLRRWTTILLSSANIPSHTADTITRLVEHVNKLSLTVIQTSSSSTAHMGVLDFYEQVAAMISHPRTLQYTQVTIPPAALTYILHFSPSPATVSRLCGILASYKQALEKIMTQSLKRKLTTYEVEHVDTFNGFLMDICNCIWRGKAFTKTDTNAQGCLVPDAIFLRLGTYVSSLENGLDIVSLFTISYSPTLSLQSISHVRQLEDAAVEENDIELQKRHAGPVTQSSLSQLSRRGGITLTWQEYRAGVLEHLEEKGLNGVPDLMYNTMKNLRDGRARKRNR